MSDFRRLAVCDFDNTLHMSPFPPEGWQGKWWSDIRSLTPPAVPERPGSEWWIAETERGLRRALSTPGTLAVVATGREGSIFEARVRELLHGRGHRPHRVYFGGDQSVSTLGWKLKTFDALMHEFPGIAEVEMWEDRDRHVTAFESFWRERGLSCVVHHVKSKPVFAKWPGDDDKGD